MSRALLTRVDQLEKVSARRSIRPRQVSIADALLEVSSQHLAGVLGTLHVAGVLDRYCDACDGGEGRPSALHLLSNTEWAEALPWDICVGCGRQLDGMM